MMRYCGREFMPQELELIRGWIAEDPKRNRAQISRLVCRKLCWHKPNGGLKEMSCRVAMLRMQADGLIHLPPPQCKKPKWKIKITTHTDPQPLIETPVHQLSNLILQGVGKSDESRLWNEYMERYHYLGYQPLAGAQLRYFVTSGNLLLALLGFGASAWQCAPRDQYVGWDHNMRKRNLHLIVNNARFLILPWIKSKNLASKTLALAARQVPLDWQKRYKYRPVLMESFVQKDRFQGLCYKAANWILVGQTKGRRKLGPAGKQSVPIKDIWLYPLHSKFRFVLKQ